METDQIIYPTARLLANPKVFYAIANWFEGPEFEVWSTSFYDLIESEFERMENDPHFEAAECCFRQSPDDPEVFQVILSTGAAMELRPEADSGKWSSVQDEQGMTVVSAIYTRLIKAIEEAVPDHKGDIALAEAPTPSNGYLRDESGDAFRGHFHLLSDSDKQFEFVVHVKDMAADDLQAEVKPVPPKTT